MTDFASLWDERDTLCELPIPDVAGGLLDLGLFCDEQTFDAVVPPQPPPPAEVKPIHTLDSAYPAQNEQNWCSLLDDDHPLHGRVSVSVSNKRRRDDDEEEDVSPAKRRKSTGIAYAQPDSSCPAGASFVFGDETHPSLVYAAPPPSTPLHNVLSPVAFVPVLSDITNESAGLVSQALSSRLATAAVRVTTPASFVTGSLRRAVSSTLLPEAMCAVNAVNVAASTYLMQLLAPPPVVVPPPKSRHVLFRQTSLAGRHRKPNVAARSTLRKRHQLTPFNESMLPLAAECMPPAPPGSLSALQCYMQQC